MQSLDFSAFKKGHNSRVVVQYVKIAVLHEVLSLRRQGVWPDDALEIVNRQVPFAEGGEGAGHIVTHVEFVRIDRKGTLRPVARSAELPEIG